MLVTGRDIALILLSIHALITCVVPLVLFFFIARGLVVVNRKTRQAIPALQDYTQRLARSVDQTSERLVAPLTNIYAVQARWQGMAVRLVTKLRSRPGNIRTR